MRKSQKDLSEFSLRLKAAREGLYTQEKLAEVSTVPLKTVKRLENIAKQENSDSEAKPLASTIMKLAQALDVTVEYLLLGDDDMNIYMEKLEKELKNLTADEIRFYHKQKLTPKVLAHLRLTDEFIDEITRYWCANTLSCYRPYVQDTIIRYAHNRPKVKENS